MCYNLSYNRERDYEEIMICPRCKRPVSDSANFCGGCGLPRAEIERFYRQQELLNIQEPKADEADALADDIRSSLDGDNYNINDEVRTDETAGQEQTGDRRTAFEVKEEPETKEYLHIRTYEDKLLFVVTPNSTNYKVMYNSIADLLIILLKILNLLIRLWLQ